VYGGRGASPRCTGTSARHWAAGAVVSGSARARFSEARLCAGTSGRARQGHRAARCSTGCWRHGVASGDELLTLPRCRQHWWSRCTRVQVSEAWFGWFGKAARDLAMATEPSMGGSGHGHGEGWVNAGLVHACEGERALGGRSGLLD
jgi:hypothetical protein